MALRLRPEIREALVEMTGWSKQRVWEEVAKKKAQHPELTSNAAGFLIAQKYGRNLLSKLTDEDKASLTNHRLLNRAPTTVAAQPALKVKASSDIKPSKLFKDYHPLDKFAEGYITELNRASSAKCYTSVFILARKIVENLIIDIILKKFPMREELVYNTKTGKTLPFSVVLKNLENEKGSFTQKGQAAITRLLQLIEPFKDDADAKTHRWYDLVKSPSEFEKWQVETIIELIKALEIEVGLRAANP